MSDGQPALDPAFAAQRMQKIQRYVEDLRHLVKATEKDLRNFKPNPNTGLFYPARQGIEGSLQITRLWFDGYRRRASRQRYLKAVTAWVSANFKNFDHVLHEWQHGARPLHGIIDWILFPPMTKEDLKSPLCINNPNNLPALKHVKPGAGRPAHPEILHRNAMIRKFYYEAQDLPRGRWYSYVWGKLEEKRIPTPLPKRYGSRWTEFAGAKLNAARAAISRALESPNREID